MVGEPACFLFFRDGILVGAIAVHVEDIIPTGDDIFQREVVDEIKKRFKISKDQEGKFTYTGMAIWTDSQGQVPLNQNKYIDEMEEIPAGLEEGKTDEECRGIIRKAVGKLLYMNLTRPYFSFKINMLSRVSPGENLRDKVKDGRQGAGHTGEKDQGGNKVWAARRP